MELFDRQLILAGVDFDVLQPELANDEVTASLRSLADYAASINAPATWACRAAAVACDAGDHDAITRLLDRPILDDPRLAAFWHTIADNHILATALRAARA